MKRLLFLFVFLAAFTTVHARYSLGFKLGANGASMLNLPAGANNTSKMSFYAGLFTRIDLGNKFLFQPELIYSRQGARLTPSELFNPESGELIAKGELNKQIRLNYINIPFVFSYNIWEDLSINLVPQVGINLNARDKTEYYDYNVTKSLSGIRRMDLSIGVGLDYKIWPRLDVAVRYNLGLTNIVKSASAFNVHNIKNGVLQLGLGFLIFE